LSAAPHLACDLPFFPSQATGNGVCTQADRFYSQVQRAYCHDIPSLENSLFHANARVKHLEAVSAQSQTQIVADLSKEVISLRKHRDQMVVVFKQLKEALQCPICTEVAILPKVLGTCGHIACQNCLKQLDDVAFATLTSSGAGASARQHLLVSIYLFYPAKARIENQPNSTNLCIVIYRRDDARCVAWKLSVLRFLFYR
jgi:hypothetical protein